MLTKNKKAFFFGFSKWKHMFMEPFFEKESFSKLTFINPFFWQKHLSLAFKRGLDEQSVFYIWGRKSFPDVEAYAHTHAIPIFRVEDGFIRSVGLGSDLTQAFSLVVDSKGIYFDPTCESDLETILQTTLFTDEMLHKAEEVRSFLVEHKLSKYNMYEHKALHFPEGKKIICAIGQVQDDASIRYGANGMSNVAFLNAVRESNQDAYIVYKPHPDVLAKNRKGHIPLKHALRLCDAVVNDVSIDSVVSVCDEVHTMTSLVGFEALMRGKKVVTYGMPFYAGWGLTYDMQTSSKRNRTLKLEELIAGTLLCYPRYIDPESLTLCDIEIFLKAFSKRKNAG